MKKGLFLLILTGFLIGIAGCTKKPVNPDAKAFKDSYESLNGTETDTGKKRLNVTIPEDNPVVFSTNSEIEQLLKEGTGVIYFGFPECPWCRSILETFLDVCKETGIEKVYYLNNKDERDTKERNEAGEIVTVKEGTADYYQILELMGDSASVYTGLEDDSVRRIYYPTVLAVKDGKILGVHVSAVKSYTDPYLGMNAAQKQELAEIYREILTKLTSCDIHTDGC